MMKYHYANGSHNNQSSNFHCTFCGMLFDTISTLRSHIANQECDSWEVSARDTQRKNNRLAGDKSPIRSRSPSRDGQGSGTSTRRPNSARSVNSRGSGGASSAMRSRSRERERIVPSSSYQARVRTRSRSRSPLAIRSRSPHTPPGTPPPHASRLSNGHRPAIPSPPPRTSHIHRSTERPTEFHHHNRPLAPRGPPPRPNGSDYPGHGGRTAAAVPSNAPNVRMRRADGTGVDVYYCDFCLVKVFREYQDLYDHKTLVCDDRERYLYDKYFVCKYCNKPFLSMFDMQAHFRTKH